MLKKQEKRKRRHRKIRSKIKGTNKIPRLCVFKSNKYIEVQVINDEKGETIVSCKKELKNAEKAGKTIAEKAKEKNIKKIVFDRGGYKYHGKVKELAEAVRKEGINF